MPNPNTLLPPNVGASCAGYVIGFGWPNEESGTAPNSWDYFYIRADADAIFVSAGLTLYSYLTTACYTDVGY